MKDADDARGRPILGTNTLLVQGRARSICPITRSAISSACGGTIRSPTARISVRSRSTASVSSA